MAVFVQLATVSDVQTKYQLCKTCRAASLSAENSVLWERYVQIENRSSSFQSLLPGGSFCLTCQKLAVSVLPVCCIMHKMCMLVPVASVHYLVLQ